MISLTQEQVKAVSSLKENPNFRKIISLLEDERSFCIEGLLRAGNDNIFTIQGRAKVLDELLKAFNTSN